MQLGDIQIIIEASIGSPNYTSQKISTNSPPHKDILKHITAKKKKGSTCKLMSQWRDIFSQKQVYGLHVFDHKHHIIPNTKE